MKLNYKQKTYILDMVIMWPSVIIAMYLLFDLWDIWNISFFENMNGFFKFLFVAVTAFFCALLLLVFFLNAYPISKNHLEIMMELEQKGFTQRFFDLSEKEINRIISVGRVYKDYRFFAMYVTFQANGYIYNGNIYAAVDSISRINLKDLQTFLKKIDKNTFLGYFDVQMTICDKLNDPFRADAVMQDAKPYLQKEYGKSVFYDMIINEVYTSYYILKGDMDKAMEYAQSCIKGDDQYRAYIGNLLIARVCLKGGKLKEASEHVDSAEKYAVNQLQKQGIEKLRREIGLAMSGGQVL